MINYKIAYFAYSDSEELSYATFQAKSEKEALNQLHEMNQYASVKFVIQGA